MYTIVKKNSKIIILVSFTPKQVMRIRLQEEKIKVRNRGREDHMILPEPKTLLQPI
jgi:hypothetical protein